MKKIFHLSLFIALSVVAKAQIAPSIQWQKCFGGTEFERAYCVQQTIDNGYIIAGSVGSYDGDCSGNHGFEDYWVLKIDNAGNLQWQTSLGGSWFDEAYSILQTIDGGYIVTGVAGSGDGNASDTHGGEDALLVKLSASGTIEWQKCIGGPGFDDAYSIQKTNDGGYVLAGSTTSNDSSFSDNHGYIDAWVVKINSFGTVEWQKLLGGSSTDIANSIQQTTDGGYIIAGSTSSYDGDVYGQHGGSSDAWIAKLNSLGAIEWQRCFGGNLYDVANSVEQTSDGNFIIVGITESDDGNVKNHHPGPNDDVWVIKLNNAGTMLWQKCLGGASTDDGYCVRETTDKGYIISGYTDSNNGDVTIDHLGTEWIIKLNKNGVIQWQETIGSGSEEKGYSVQQTSDGGFITAGYTDGNSGDVSGNHGEPDAWIVKLGNKTDASKTYFYNQIVQNKNFSTPYLLDSASVSNTKPNPVKICADGSNATFIEYDNYNTNVQLANIAFRIKEDQGSSNKSVYGYFDTPTDVSVNPQINKAFYNHPTYMSLDSIYRTVNVQVYDKSTGAVLYTYPIHIYRAPLLCVHGIFGSDKTFEAFENDLINKKKMYPGFNISPLTYRMNYPNSASFKDNRAEVMRGIDELLTKVISNKYSAGKVDIVGHSMGGVVSRIYIQNAYNSNPYRNDVHKLITLNTPHSGSQLADWGITSCAKFLAVDSWVYRGVGFACGVTVFLNQALIDLQVNSPATDYFLNGHSKSKTALVPTIAISTFLNNIIYDPSIECGIVSAVTNNSAIFSNATNDQVVAVISQQGGISPVPNALPNICHIGSPDETTVINQAASLINDPPTSAYFDIDGYSPADLTYTSTTNKAILVTGNQTINFTAPAHGTSFKPGQTIKVSAKGSTETKSMELSAGNEVLGVITFDTVSKTLSYNYIIPINAAGAIRMIVFGIDSADQYVFDTLSINVKPTAKLDSIAVYPTNISVPQYQHTTFEISGYYHDGYVRDITGIPEIKYVVNDTNVAVHNNYNEITGKKIDTTSIKITYLGKSKIVPVKVLDGSDYLHAGFIATDSSVCFGQSVTFTNYSTENPLSYKWQLSGGTPATSSQQNPTITYKKAGQFDVTLIATYATKKDTLVMKKYITVDSVPAKPTITANGSITNICPGKMVTLTSSIGKKYLWSTGDTTTSIVVTVAGSYSVKIANTSGCSSVSSDVTVVTFQPCGKATNLTVSNVATTSANLSWAGVNCAVSYQYEWKKKGTATWLTGKTTSTNKTLTGLASSTIYQWRVFTACKISPDSIKSGYATGPEFTTLGNGFTVSNSNISIENSNLSSLVPNPATNSTRVLISASKGYVTVTLSDLSGKLLWQSKKQLSGNITIPLSRFANGTYVVKIQDEQTSQVLKLVKSN